MNHPALKRWVSPAGQVLLAALISPLSGDIPAAKIKKEQAAVIYSYLPKKGRFNAFSILKLVGH